MNDSQGIFTFLTEEELSEVNGGCYKFATIVKGKAYLCSVCTAKLLASKPKSSLSKYPTTANLRK